MASLFKVRGPGESAGNLVGDALVMMVAIAFFISVIFNLSVILQVTTNSALVPAIFIIWPLTISMPTIFAHWTWLKYMVL
ncbi:hypothetical protein [Bifidobacterium sp. M0353]|uniref:hypothetical protein n=1 Tax=Bifidobacterium sp. M0353 TaxID=2751006 RepID=UPI0018DC30C3|nr:hypothetical protein [Bifidobacterium sp. M0353]MBI0150451.1 hypothetical protein [Bifidobacterium sp. M0353]